MPHRRSPTPVLAALTVLPLWTALCGGRTHAVGHTTPDLEGHLWTIWQATLGSPTQAELLSWPEGVDLLPILGGWGDILVASVLAPATGVPLAYNLTMGLYLLLAGLGGLALGRAFQLGWLPAVLCGLLLQLDPATLQHLWAGRAEQVGVGILALFVATGVHTGRQSGRLPVLFLGLTGALSLAVAWEYALFVAALGLGLLVLAEGSSGRRRVVGGGIAAVVLALPAVALFATHSAAASGGRFAEEWSLRAAQNALVPGVHHTWAAIRPATVPALCLLALPWTTRKTGRRLALVIGAGLVVSLLLALGPEPTLVHRPPTGSPAGWAPFTWLASLPGLSRYQTPARLMVPWTLAAPLAAAFAVAAVKDRSPRGGLTMAAVVLVVSVVEVLAVWPRAAHTPTDFSSFAVLAEDPHPGGVYDLPPHRRGGRTIVYQQAQVVHGRGILHHSLQPYLSGSGPLPEDPFLTWATDPTASPPPDALESLRARDFGFVVVHDVKERGHRAPALGRHLTAVFGKPAHTGQGWQAWRVE